MWVGCCVIWGQLAACCRKETEETRNCGFIHFIPASAILLKCSWKENSFWKLICICCFHPAERAQYQSTAFSPVQYRDFTGLQYLQQIRGSKQPILFSARKEKVLFVAQKCFTETNDTSVCVLCYRGQSALVELLICKCVHAPFWFLVGNVCTQTCVRLCSHRCLCVLILDVAAGKASLPCVTESLIISHSAPHTVARKMEEIQKGGKRVKVLLGGCCNLKSEVKHIMRSLASAHLFL